MTKFSLSDLHVDQPNQDDPKVRQCLRCESAFESQWAGERICARCKSSNAWRSGIPVRASNSGGRR